MRFVLVHSPVVGPSTWRWVAAALRAAGHQASVPDLVTAAETGDPGVFVREAVAAANADEEAVLVGHSGAGAVLPLVAAGMARKPRLVVFVDAGMPPCDGAFSAGGDFLGRLQGLATQGLLPPWSQWWGEEVLESLVRDGQRRRQFEAELPQVPVRFYEASIQVPPDWCAGAGAYVLLSEAYSRDASNASSIGWPVVERPGEHLDIVNDEDAIADLLISLSDRS